MNDCSDNSLEAMQIAQQGLAAERRKMAHRSIEEAIEAEVTAKAAEILRLLRSEREELRKVG